jgi:hypothetical protein
MPTFNTFTGASSRALGIISSDPPGTPVLTSSATATTVTVNLTIAEGAFPITAIEYEAKTSAASYSGIWTLLPAATRSITLTGLSTSTTYNIKVRAKDLANQYSVEAEKSQGTSDEVVPGTPASVSVTAAGTTILTVSFGASTVGTYPIAKYQYSLDGGSYTDTGVSPGQSFNIGGLGVYTSHTVAIKALASSPGTGISSARTSGSVLTNPSVPSVPTINWARMSADDRTTAKLQWNSVTTNTDSNRTGTVTYYIYPYEVDGSENVIANLTVQSTTSTSIDIATSENKNYRFYVYANNAIGQNNGASYRGALTTGRTNVPWSLDTGIAEVHIGRQRVADGTGAITLNFPAVPANYWNTGFIHVNTAKIYIKRATIAATIPNTSGSFGNTQGLHFVLTDAQNGTGNFVESVPLPSTKTAAQGFNVTNEYEVAGFDSPFIINFNRGGGSISNRSLKVTEFQTTRFSQPISNYGVFANPSNNLLAFFFRLDGYQSTGSTYN